MYLNSPCLLFDEDLFPIKNGKYEVDLGLKKCHGEKDFFHRDKNFEFYLNEKKKNLKENPHKYYLFSENFLEIDKELTSELSSIWNRQNPDKLISAIDLKNFGFCVQEDIAITMKNSQGKDFVAALHLSFPNHWDPREKFMQDFNFVHSPIANIEPLINISDKIVNMMFEKGPYKRFAWGISTDTRLNHHPEAPLNIDINEWKGRSYREGSNLFLRIERQIIWPIKKLGASVFTIKTYFFDIKDLVQNSQDALDQLISAIDSMNDASLNYKGLVNDRGPILCFLRAQRK